MGKLYDAVEQVHQIIERKGLDPFRTKGQLSMRTGFLLTFIRPEDPDDQEKIDALQEAALEVLGEQLDV